MLLPQPGRTGERDELAAAIRNETPSSARIRPFVERLDDVLDDDFGAGCSSPA